MGASVHAQREKILIGPYHIRMICIFHRNLSTLRHSLAFTVQKCKGMGTSHLSSQLFRRSSSSHQAK